MLKSDCFPDLHLTHLPGNLHYWTTDDRTGKIVANLGILSWESHSNPSGVIREGTMERPVIINVCTGASSRRRGLILRLLQYAIPDAAERLRAEERARIPVRRGKPLRDAAITEGFVLRVLPSNTGAIAVYEKAGFVPIWQDAVSLVMEKFVNPPTPPPHMFRSDLECAWDAELERLAEQQQREQELKDQDKVEELKRFAWAIGDLRRSDAFRLDPRAALKQANVPDDALPRFEELILRTCKLGGGGGARNFFSFSVIAAQHKASFTRPSHASASSLLRNYNGTA